jgi:hypothetical protein
MAILTESIWESTFPNADPFYTYDNFMEAVSRFPKFCGEANGSSEEADLVNSCKIDLATFLAHVRKSSDDLQHVAHSTCSTTGAGTTSCDYINSSFFSATSG